MKRIISVILISIFTVIILAVPASANLLEECEGCNVSGKCQECLGAKSFDCPNCEDGKKPCNCADPSNSLGPGYWGTNEDGSPHICDACGGTGRANCTRCNGTSRATCHACEGKGTCGICNGTGYRDYHSDGITNVPKNGDTVVKLNGQRFVWGNATTKSSSSKTTKKQSSTGTTAKQNASTTNAPAGTDTSANGEIERLIENPHERGEISDCDKAACNYDTTNMTNDELKAYTELPEEKRAEVFKKVSEIVKTASVGKVSNDTQSTIDTLIKSNNIQNTESAKVCGISFDGHIDIGFPVKVSVNIDKNLYTTNDKIYVYHILEDGKVESLGEAEKITEGEKVISLVFETSGFSDFFSSTEMLELPAYDSGSANDGTLLDKSATKKNSPSTLIIAIISVSVVAVATVVVVILVKKAKAKSEEE